VATGVDIFRLLKYLASEFLLILDLVLGVRAAPGHREVGVRRRPQDRSRGGHPDRLLLQPRRHRELPDDGLDLHADALGKPLAIGEQISLLLLMIIASKGAAGVSAVRLATLAGGLSSHRPDLLDVVGLIVGVDRFMSEARPHPRRGQRVATVLVGHWTGTLNREQLDTVLAGERRFEETSTLDDDHSEGDRQAPVPAYPQGTVDSSSSRL